MNFYLKTLLPLCMLFLTISSCSKDEESSSSAESNTSDTYEFKGITIANNYSNIPTEALEYDSVDFIGLMNTGLKSSSSSDISLDALGSIDEENLTHYPDYDRLDSTDVEWIKKDFPTLTETEIYEKIDTIAEYYEQCLRYEMCVDISNYEDDSTVLTSSSISLKSYSTSNLSSEEKYFLILHPKAAVAINKATTNAASYAASYYSTDTGKKDAFRHCTWSTLIAKYYGYAKRYKSKGISMSKKFTNLHETSHWDEAEDYDHEMDYHNNAVGRNYYDDVAVQHKKKRLGIVIKRWVTSPSADTMAEYLYDLVENSGVKVDATVDAIDAIDDDIPVYYF